MKMPPKFSSQNPSFSSEQILKNINPHKLRQLLANDVSTILSNSGQNPQALLARISSQELGNYLLESIDIQSLAQKIIQYSSTPTKEFDEDF